MKNTKTLSIIDGNFTSDEAREILSEMISFKINFHSLKNWSSLERYGKDDEVAQKRIPILKKEMEKLHAILSEAQKNNKRLVVSADVNITLIDE